MWNEQEETSDKEVKKHPTEIFEYIRRNHGGKTHKVGVIVGIRDNGTIRLGWSKCNVGLDKFDAAAGLDLAKQRALGNFPITPIPGFPITPIPGCIKKQYRTFAARCVRYFKDAHTMIIDRAL